MQTFAKPFEVMHRRFDQDCVGDKHPGVARYGYHTINWFIAIPCQLGRKPDRQVTSLLQSKVVGGAIGCLVASRWIASSA